MEDKDFDKLIAQKLSDRTLDVSENAWERISVQLPKAKKSGLPKLWWVAAVLVAGIFIWSPWKNQPAIPVTEVEVPVSIPDNKENNTLSMPDKNRVQPLVENTEIPTVQKTQPNPTTIQKKTVLTQKEVIAVSQKIGNEQLTPTLQQEPGLQSVQPERATAIAQNTEVDHNQLILSQLKERNPTYRINAQDLLQMTESEIAIKNDKPIKEVIFQKFKNTIQVALR